MRGESSQRGKTHLHNRNFAHDMPSNPFDSSTVRPRTVCITPSHSPIDKSNMSILSRVSENVGSRGVILDTVHRVLIGEDADAAGLCAGVEEANGAIA
jgi:hypothetical protein